MGNEGRFLDERPDPDQLRAPRTGRRPEQLRRASRRSLQSEQHSQRRGLSRAVRSEKTAYLASLDREREILDGSHVAELLPHAVDDDDGLTHGQDPRTTSILPPPVQRGAGAPDAPSTSARAGEDRLLPPTSRASHLAEGT